MLEKEVVELAIITLDILRITRDILDLTVKKIEEETSIPPAHILINCTHTYHTPSTMRVHGYAADFLRCECREALSELPYELMPSSHNRNVTFSFT